MKRKLVTSGLLAGLVAGGGAGLILQQSGFAGAANGLAAVVVDDTTPDTTTATTDPTTDTGTDATTDTTDQVRPDRSDRLREVLQPLVDDGTLTADQLEAVVSALDAAGPVGDGPMGEGGPMGPGGRHGHGGMHIGLDAAATALGLTADELRTELEGGSSITDVAAAKGIDVQTVIDAMVAEATQRIDDRVAAGDLTQEEADAKIADLTERVTDAVDNIRPDRPAHDDAADEAGDDTSDDAAA
ncbi:MAG: hypothetical protein HZB15_05700 [Actinobacteria bacterium]|nr:hypothetical protein [Actinomycetota bacterium]